MNAEWLEDDSLGEPETMGFEWTGGVEGTLLTEAVDDAGDIALELKVVTDDGADTGSSSEMYLAPSSMLSGSSAAVDGAADVFGKDGWLSDQGDLSGGGGA